MVMNGYETVLVESGDRPNSQHLWKITDKNSFLLETIQIKVNALADTLEKNKIFRSLMENCLDKIMTLLWDCWLLERRSLSCKCIGTT